jgi:hypothetical protein
MSKAKGIATSKAKEMATIGGSMVEQRPSWMAVDSSRGNEGVKVEDMTVPRLSIIQDLSPQHKKGKSEYIDGATPKMIFNTVTNELYDEEVFVVPVLFRKEYVIWKDIDSGGGFRGAFGSMEEAVEAREELDDRDQCEIVDTAQHFVLILDPISQPDEPVFSTAVISMSKSQMKVSRKWNSQIHEQGGDRWVRIYNLRVVDDKNAAGQEYYNWQPRQLGFVSKPLYDAAEALYDAIKSGALDIKREEATAGSAEHEAGAVTEDDDF